MAIQLSKALSLMLTVSSLGFLVLSVLLMMNDKVFAALLSFVTGMILLSSGISMLKHESYA
ncbi:MAG: hypothetical protein DRO12_06370 [Thermoprotei archaeon]|nr:MAG: hypothetical protein DRO12_06370 [Thermoprotei archaeon]